MANRQNGVRGPHSALTDFLASMNITATSVARRAQTRNASGLRHSTTAAPPEEEEEQNEEEEEEYKSDRLDEEDDEGGVEEDGKESEGSPSKKRKLEKGKGKASPAKDKGKGKAKATPPVKGKGKVKKPKKKDSDYEDSDEDSYRRPASDRDPSAKPPNGAMEECAECGEVFTVTRYTLPHPVTSPGWLCHPCAQTLGLDPFAKVPKVVRKRKATTEKRKVVNFEEVVSIGSLTSLCIDMIARHLSSIEQLGDIGAMNTEEILKVIAKRRCLSEENVLLFYGSANEELIIWDGTNLKAPALKTLALLNPNLVELRIDYCGHLTSEGMIFIGQRLVHLRRLELLGPFLVRKEGWLEFFKTVAGGNLERFLIRQSPRFDLECCEALVEHHPKLTHLRLSEIGKIDDEWLFGPLGNLTALTSLELSYPTPGTSLSDAAVVKLLSKVGAGLTKLDLSGNEALTDMVLKDGVGPHCSNLSVLVVASLPELTDEGVKEFFDTWSASQRLTHLDMGRCPDLSSSSIEGILEHSGPILRELSINSWKEASEKAVASLGPGCANLERVDVSWCRDVDDFTIKALLDGCEKLEWIKCYGCNKVTENCPRKRNVKIFGVEGHTASRV